MPLRFTGIDPNTGGGGSPTVWVADDKRKIVIQGWTVDAATLAEIADTEWVPGHATGVPDRTSAGSPAQQADRMQNRFPREAAHS